MAQRWGCYDGENSRGEKAKLKGSLVSRGAMMM